jgi:probable rRNA maturation factor
MVIVSIHSSRTVPRSLETVIRKTVQAGLPQLPPPLRRKLTGKKRYRLEVSLVTRAAIRKVNARFRHKDKATDVLSFSRWEGMPMPIPEIGDILICWPIAKTQAKENGLTVPEEVARLTAHGFLHLFGYDHEKSKAQAKKMFRLQDKIFARVTRELPR